MGFGSSKPKLKNPQKLFIDEQRQKGICKIRINKEDIGYGFLALSPKTKILVTKMESSYFLPTEVNGKKKENDIKLIINSEDPILLTPNEERIIYHKQSHNIKKIKTKKYI